MNSEPKHRLKYHEIVSLQDSFYDSWLDLYQAAFPVGEQMRVSEHNRALRSKADAPNDGVHYLTALDDAGALLGMTRYDVVEDAQAAALWYLATVPEARSKGIGGELYHEVRRRVQEELPSVQALIFEVEAPDMTHTEEERGWAVKRIAFYHRMGAQTLKGIDYVQSVGWQPPMPMWLMVHPYAIMDADEAFALAKSLLGDALQQTASLTFD